MLSACGGSAPKPRSLPAPDPVIVTRTVEVRVCPPELQAARPARPLVPDGAMVTGNDAGMDWLVQSQAYTALLEDRLDDAAAQCPKETGK